MLDLHKLKLKYRELSSKYADSLKQPIFKNSKRSYVYLPAKAPSEMKVIETKLGTAEQQISLGSQAVQDNLGETTSQILKVVDDQTDVGEGERARASLLANMGDLP